VGGGADRVKFRRRGRWRCAWMPMPTTVPVGRDHGQGAAQQSAPVAVPSLRLHGPHAPTVRVHVHHPGTVGPLPRQPGDQPGQVAVWRLPRPASRGGAP
jgi:hypothetical protein